MSIQTNPAQTLTAEEKAEIIADLHEQNKIDFKLRLEGIQEIMAAEMRQRDGKLTESADFIFGRLLTDLFDNSAFEDIPVDFGHMADNFFKFIAKSPEGGPLNRFGHALVQDFFEGKWEPETRAQTAIHCYTAIMDDKGRPRGLPKKLGERLGEIYWQELREEVRPDTLRATLGNASDSKVEELMADTENHMDRTLALTEHLTENSGLFLRLKRLLTTHEDTLEICKSRLGLTGPVGLAGPARPGEATAEADKLDCK